MSTFPTARPSYTGFTPGHTLVVDAHASQHNAEQADISALSDKVGLGASTPSAGLVLAASGTGTSSWSQVNLTTMVSGVLPVANGGTGQSNLTNVPLVSPAITGGGSWAGSPTISTPIIADLTNAIHTHQNNAGGGTLNAASALQAGTVSFANLLSTIFSGQVVTDTNTGGGLGTRNFVNLGGIKILWGTTTAQSLVNNANLSLNVVFGTTFSTTPVMIGIPHLPPDNRVSAVVSLIATTNGTILLQSNNSATNNVAADWFVIGI